jgi:putative ABC transport system substrate-binding protein
VTDRRAFLSALAGGLLAAPIAAAAQSGSKVHRVGYLSTAGSVFEPFRQGLRELGYVEGQNLVLDVRLAHGRLDRLPALAAELVGMRPDVIAAVSSPAIRATKQATTTIPIVMAFSGDDPVRHGFVKSLARPGGNITGVAMIADELTGKRGLAQGDASESYPNSRTDPDRPSSRRQSDEGGAGDGQVIGHRHGRRPCSRFTRV